MKASLLAPDRHEGMIESLLAHYDASTTTETQEGLSWYQTTHDTGIEIARKTGYSPEVVWGVIAALSPRVEWDLNVRQAIDLLLHGESAVCSTYKPNKRKALRIRDLAPEEVEAQFSPDSKTWAFFRLMRDPSLLDVCGDTWHFRAMGLPDGSMAGPQYRTMVRISQEAAARRAVLPHQLQAVVWLHIRNITLAAKRGKNRAVAA